MSEGGGESPLPPLGTAPRQPERERTSGFTRRKPPDLSPWHYIGMGALIVAVLGGLATEVTSAFFAFVATVVVGLGGILIAIGTIAEGIRLGARWVRFERGE